VNHAENAFLEKVCKIASFFVTYPEIDHPEGQTVAAEGPE